MKIRRIFVGVACACIPQAAVADEWPGLRGPRHDGTAPGRLGSAAEAGLAVAWRATLISLLVGGDLAVLTKESVLHVGPASPEGWQERTRVTLFDDVVWSPPGFADGGFFARGQSGIARVEWRAGGAAAAARTNTRFAAFLRERGYLPAGGESNEGGGWAGWGNRTDRVFAALFPPQSEEPPLLAE